MLNNAWSLLSQILKNSVAHQLGLYAHSTSAKRRDLAMSEMAIACHEMYHIQVVITHLGTVR